VDFQDEKFTRISWRQPHTKQLTVNQEECPSDGVAGVVVSCRPRALTAYLDQFAQFQPYRSGFGRA